MNTLDKSSQEIILKLVESKYEDLVALIKDMYRTDVPIDVYEESLHHAEIYKDLRNQLRKIVKENNNGNS